MYTKLVPKTVHYISFTKFIWNYLYLLMICIMYLDSSTKAFSATLKPSISRVTLSKNASLALAISL